MVSHEVVIHPPLKVLHIPTGFTSPFGDSLPTILPDRALIELSPTDDIVGEPQQIIEISTGITGS
jgi:hypothetical protein